MMAAVWVAQNFLHASVPLSLLEGWVVFLAIMTPFALLQLRSESELGRDVVYGASCGNSR